MALVGILEGAKVSLEESFSLLWQLLASFGHPAGFQKSTKNRSQAEKASPKTTFLAIFNVVLLYFTFWIGFSSILDENLMFSVFFFAMSCGLVSNLATLTIVRILRVQTHSFIFPFSKKLNQTL